MAHYRCIRCGGESDDKEKIDHARGLVIGRPCAGGGDAPIEDLRPKKATAKVEETPKAETPKAATPKIPTKKTKKQGKP